MKMYVTSGTGTAKEDKNALDRASVQGGFGRLNIVNVSSILAPDIEEIDKEQFQSLTKDGQIVHAIHGVTMTNVPGQIVTSALAFIRNVNKSETGYVCELFGIPGIDSGIIKQRVEKMVLQLYCDENEIDTPAYDPIKTTYTVDNGEEVEIRSIVAEDIGNLNGDYTCTIVAIFLIE